MSSTDETVLLGEARLRDHAEALLAALGVGEADAAQTADVFLQAELMGEHSHGLRLFLQVLERIRAGGDRTVTDIGIEMDRGAVALWDGRRSIGQVTAARAMRDAIGKARAHGIGFVAVKNSNSFTSAKYYPLLACAEGMIGCAFTNTSRKLMPPPGGVLPVIGNNPVAYGAPAGKYGAFVLDMACTEAAVEKIVRAHERGEPIPEGWALDAEGNPTTDAGEALKSLALLPFGGHKAFNLAVVHEILTSVIAGGELFAGEATGFKPYDAPMNTSYSMIAIDLSAFQPLADFEARMEQVIARLKAGGRPGAPEPLHAGERSLATLAERRRTGIPLASQTAMSLDALAAALGIGSRLLA